MPGVGHAECSHDAWAPSYREDNSAISLQVNVIAACRKVSILRSCHTAVGRTWTMQTRQMCSARQVQFRSLLRLLYKRCYKDMLASEIETVVALSGLQTGMKRHRGRRSGFTTGHPMTSS